MKTFKQFVLEQAELGIPQGLIGKDGVPSAVILTPSDEERQVQQKKEDESLSEDWSSVGTDHNELEPHGKDRPSVSSPGFQDWKNGNPNKHLGNTVSDVHHSLSKSSTFSEGDREHINRYSRSSNTLNKTLYNKHLDGEAVPEHIAAKRDETVPHHVPSLDKSLSHPIGHDLHVMTGTRFNVGAVAAQHPEGHVKLPAYTSTSISPVVAHQFAMPDENKHLHVLQIHLKAGDKARYTAPISHFGHEKEAILPRNTTLKVHPTPDVHTDGSGSKVHVWHATVHSQE